MLGDNLSDFSIGVEELIQMTARLDPEPRRQMTEMMQGYLSMANAGFMPSSAYSTDEFEPKYSWPFLREQVEQAVTKDPYTYPLQ